MQHSWLFSFFFLTVVPLANWVTSLIPWDDMRIKHAWHADPVNWENLGHPPAGTTIDLYIALKPEQKDALIDALYEVSNPGHPRYGAHLFKGQVAELVKPHLDTLELVGIWLGHHSIRSSSISTTHGGAWLTVTDVLVSQANRLLSASYQLYRNAKTNETIVRTVSYALPAVLHTHIQTVAPTTFFASTRAAQQTLRRHSFRATPAQAQAASEKPVTGLSSRDSDAEILPSFLRWLYKTSEYKPAATEKNTLAIAGFKDDQQNHEDLTEFMTNYYAEAEDATFIVIQVNDGEFDPSNPTKEANVDVQFAEAMAYPTPLIFYSTGGSEEWSRDGKVIPRDMYLEWFNYILREPDMPQTVSISYGGPEEEFPPEYADALCSLFARLGVLGVSVLVASGDDGIGAGKCDDGSGNAQFMPAFPASCPYVTSVGGTRDYNPEIAASFSGGGFSYYFPRPSFQDNAVPRFLQGVGDKHAGRYNSEGRGIPDISAQALNYAIIVKNADFVVKGTSCAAPTAAGIISLLNDYLISTDKPALGFLNPLLYGDGEGGFNDITTGFNMGCNTGIDGGFSTTTGWDPVTGLGTPDFVKLKDIVKKRKVASAYQGISPTPTELPKSSDIINSLDPRDATLQL